MIQDLPPHLSDQLLPASIAQLERGRLGNQLLRVRTQNGTSAYLKIGQGEVGRDLSSEADRLDWIANKLPVPRVLFHGVEKDTTYLLMTAINGIPSHESLQMLRPEAVIDILARTLKRIHSVSVGTCPFIRVVEQELVESERRMRDQALDESAFEKSTGRTPQVVLKYLTANADTLSDVVFTHGDYALPNVILTGDRLGGIIDWGIAGIADLHRDFMCIEKSITRNIGGDWVNLFYARYGYGPVDRERIRFFWLLDQFYQHYKASI